MRPKVTQSHISFKKKTSGQTPIRQMNKSQVSATSEMEQSRSQKSLSQDHSKLLLRSGNQTLLERMNELPEDVVRLKQQNAQLRIMQLSEEARQSLMKLQRFDRFIFPLESDRILKIPIGNQLKRLQKIKNEQLEMRGKLYDNQLTITALFNHIKLIWQMNRQLEEREVLRKQKDEALRKMHQQKRQSLKEVRQLKQQIRSGSKTVTPIKNEKPQEDTPQVNTTPLKKQQIVTLNFISATMRGKKYVEGIEEIKKFLSRSSSTQPEACRLLQMFLPALEDQVSTLVETKTIETKLTEITGVLQKVNKEIRLNHFDELQKIKNQALKPNSTFKSIGLMLESMLNMKKLDEAEKLKKNIPNDSRSLDKATQKVKSIEQQLKLAKEQLIKQKVTNAENLKIKQNVEKQLEKLKGDFERLQLELQNVKKIETQQNKRTITRTTTTTQVEVKTVREQLSRERILKQNLEKQLEKLKQEVQTNRKNQVQTKKTALRRPNMNDEESRQIKQQLNAERNIKLNLEKENQKLQTEIKTLREQLNLEKNSKLNHEKQVQKTLVQLETLRKNEAEVKRSAQRTKQNEQDLKNVRQQLNSQRTSKATLEKQNKKLQNQLKPLREEITIEKNNNAELQNQIQRLEAQIEKTKKESVNSRRPILKSKQDDQIKLLKQQIANQVSKSNKFAQYIEKQEAEINSLREQLSQARASNNEIVRTNKNLEKQIQNLKNQNEKLRKTQGDLQTLRRSEVESRKVMNKAKSTEEQLAKVKEQLVNQKYELTESIRSRKSTQNILQKLKTENERLKSIQTLYQDLKHSQTEFKRTSQKLKSTVQQFRATNQQLEGERSKNYNLSRAKDQLQRQIEKLMAEIEMYRKNEVEFKTREFETIKKIQIQAKSKQQLLIQNLRQDAEKSQLNLNFSLDSLQRIIKASTSVKPSDDLEKLRRQLTSSHHSFSRKMLPLLETFIRSHNRSLELEAMIDKMGKQENERRRKSQAEAKSLTNQLTQLRQNGNTISQSLKSAARMWGRTKSESLVTDNKMIEILSAQLKKGNHNHHLEQVEFEIIAIVESVVNIMVGQISKIEDRYMKQLQQKNRQLEKANFKQVMLVEKEGYNNKKIEELEQELKNSYNSTEQMRKECLTNIKELERIMKEHERVIHEANLHSEQLSKQVQANSVLNRELAQLKKEIAKITSQKQAKQISIQEAQQEILRLKRYNQNALDQERKVLQNLETEGKEKQKFQRQLENLQRLLEKTEKQRQFFERKTKTQDGDLLKLKQLQISLQNLIQENQIKTITLQNTINTRDRQLKNLQEKNRITQDEKSKGEEHILLLEKQLANIKFDAEKAHRLIRDNQQLYERQKHDLTMQIQRLNLQLKFYGDEKQSEKKHYSTIISRLEKNLNDAQAHRAQEVKQFQLKVDMILKQKEEARKQLQNQQSKYRQKLREVNKDLQLTSHTGERQKVEMKRQIDRLTQELTNFVESSEYEKNELRKSVEKLMGEKQKLHQERVEEKRLCMEEIQRAKNEEYQLNYDKLKKQREQIRQLQEQVDKLNEVIDINQVNYNKIVEDNRQMYEKISELESSQKNYTQEVQMLKDKSLGDLNNAHLQVSRNSELIKQIERLQAQTKEFEIIIAGNTRQIALNTTQKARISELQSRVQELQHENMKLKIHQDENLRQLNKYKEENIQLRTQNAALDRELYATKSRPDSSQSEALLLSKYQDMARKYEEVNQQSLKYRFQTTNFERLLKEKELQTIKNLQIKHLQMQKDMLENTWKQRMDALNQRQKELTKELEVIRGNFEAKKDQHNTDIMNFKIEKDRLERSLSDLEKKLVEAKEQIGKINKEAQIREQQRKILQEKYNSLQKNYEDKAKQTQKLDNQLRNQSIENKQLSQQLIAKEETNNRQIQKFNDIFSNKIEGLQKEIEAKRKLVQQKQLQIRQLITKLSSHTNEKAALATEKQVEYQTSFMLSQRTIQDLKKQNERLNTHLDTATKKLQEKMLEGSNLLLQLKQSQSDKLLSEEQFKYKIESLSSKNTQLHKEVESLRSQLKDRAIGSERERQNYRQEKDRFEKAFSELNHRTKLLEDSLQKVKLEKVTLIQREKALRAQLESREEELLKIQQKNSKIQGGSMKMRQQNKYLKEIVQMLDTNYVEDEEDDQNEIKILMKISEQIGYLIERNIQLQTQNKSVNQLSHTNDQEWLSSIQFLIESLLEYLNETELMGHRNVTKFVYSAEFKATSLYSQKEKYMVYVENFIKELFQSVVTELSENIALYQRTISDMKKFVESYFVSRDPRFLESLRKCLSKFES